MSKPKSTIQSSKEVVTFLELCIVTILDKSVKTLENVCDSFSSQNTLFRYLHCLARTKFLFDSVEVTTSD